MNKTTLGTLNSLNEEDESPVNFDGDSSSSNEAKQLNTVNEDEQQQQEIDTSATASDEKSNINKELALEKEKLRESINNVFKTVPYCEPPLISMLMDNDTKRSEYLEQVLINRLVYNSLINEATTTNISENQPLPHHKFESVAEYATYLGQVFNKKNFWYDKSRLKDNEVFLELAGQCLFLSGLSLTSSNMDKIQNLNSLVEKDAQTFTNEDRQSLEANIHRITFVCLSKNSLNSDSSKYFLASSLNVFQNLEILDLSENKFESFDFLNLTAFIKLKELNLSANLLKHLLPSFMKNEQAEELFFLNSSSNNKKEHETENVNLGKLSETLFNSLERLNLANNSLNSVNTSILAHFKSLKYLNLSNNSYSILINTGEDSRLPWQLAANNELSNLIELDLSSNNKITSETNSNSYQKNRKDSAISTRRSSAASALSNKSFSSLKNLRILNLSDNGLKNMPKDINDLKHLETLDLSKNSLEFLPFELTELKSLKCLKLNENKIEEVTDTFCTYARFRESLEELNLSKNLIKLAKFSYRIALFVKLKTLNLSENQFDQIPSILPNNLELLNMNQNKIRTLMTRPLANQARNDDEVLNILGLDKVLINHNKKSSMSQRVNVDLLDSEESESVKRKRELAGDYDRPEVDHREEFVLPHVFYLRNLKQLHLSGNQIQDVPNDFSILNSSLIKLDLSFNLLTHLPVSLCRSFGDLKSLNLEANRIRDLSDKLRELNELEYLNLRQNRLVNLTYELCFSLKNLKELYLASNLLENLPLFSPYNKLLNRSSRPNTSTTTFRPNSAKSSTYFTFNLPKLRKIDLSFNRFKDQFSLYKTFALCTSLEEINLHSNQIRNLEIVEENEAEDGGEQERNSPKLKLKNLKQINLSNNQFRYYDNDLNVKGKGGFLRMLCNLYRLAPCLETFLYDQSSGAKLGIDLIALKTEIKEPEKQIVKKDTKISAININTILNEDVNNAKHLLSTRDDDLYFDFNEKEELILDINEEEAGGKVEHCFDRLCINLKTIDLSHNNLTKIPQFIYRLRALRKIYFNGNHLRKIPSELYNKNLLNGSDSKEDEQNFEKLKQAQLQRIKEELRRKRLEAGEEMEEEEGEEEQEEETNSRKKKKKNKQTKVIVIEQDVKQDPVADHLVVQDPVKLIAESLEVIHLNDNQIEYVPDSIFTNFKRLKEIKLLNNPLRDPPHESLCISSANLKLRSSRVNSFRDKIKNEDQNSNKQVEISSLIPIENNLKRDDKVAIKSSASASSAKTSSSFSTSVGLPSIAPLKDAFNNNIKMYKNKFSLEGNEESEENLKPLKSYMTRFKTREGQF
jgi:leucine-rich repeat protein SHOC2